MLLITRDGLGTVRMDAERGGRDLIAHAALNGTESFALVSEVQAFEPRRFRVPASHHEKRDLIVSPDDPNGTGRPVTFTQYNRPNDGDAVEVLELSGYWAPHDSAAGGTVFTRDTVRANSPKTSIGTVSAGDKFPQ